MAHSRFAPSSDERNTACPPSFLLNEKAPNRQSPDAAHGTAAHRIGELCLRTDQDVETYSACTLAVDEHGNTRFVHEKAPIKDDEFSFEVDDEMVVAVQQYVDRCRANGSEHYVEVRVDVTKWCPDLDEHGEPLGPQFGTSDHIGVDPRAKKIYVDDLKYGKGVKVYAKENKQAIKYAVGTVDEYAWEFGIDDSWTVVITIHQPRLDHFDTWEITVAELYRYAAQIKQQLTEVFNPNAAFNPGEKQCKFCAVSARCKPRAEKLFNDNAYQFDDLTLEAERPPALMTDEELVHAWSLWPQLKQLYKAIDDEVRRRMFSDAPLPALKLVKGKGSRSFVDEESARDYLLSKGVEEEQLYEKAFLSPNKAEKLLDRTGKEELKQFVRYTEGGPAIVSADDPRDEYKGNAQYISEFDDVDDDGFGE